MHLSVSPKIMTERPKIQILGFNRISDVRVIIGIPVGSKKKVQRNVFVSVLIFSLFPCENVTLFRRQALGLVICHLALRVGVRAGYILAGVTAFITEKYFERFDIDNI